MQCHLETTSRRLPSVIKRFERGQFSYRPNEPLGNFAIYFDNAPGSGTRGQIQKLSSSTYTAPAIALLPGNRRAN